MPLPIPVKKQKPLEQTGEEPKYLKALIDAKAAVRVKLVDDSEVEGTIEYYDATFIRVTRDGEPNLFLFKHFIKYIAEL